jgi:hypothetical protein
MAASTYNTTLTDAVITVDAGGLDDGALTAASSPVTVCIDQMSIQFTGRLIDVSCAQDLSEFNRIVKRGLEVTITTKIGNNGMTTGNFPFLVSESWDASPTNSLYKITFALGGATITMNTVAENAGISGDEPPTFTANFKAYGDAITIT